MVKAVSDEDEDCDDDEDDDDDNGDNSGRNKREYLFVSNTSQLVLSFFLFFFLVCK